MNQISKRSKANHLIAKTSQFTPKYQSHFNLRKSNKSTIEEFRCDHGGMAFEGKLMFSKTTYLNIDAI